MTDSDLRELDGWIAEHFLGKTICPGEYDHILTEDNQVLLAPNYSSDPAAFSLVKREVERRGWDWSSDFVSHHNPVKRFRFTVFKHITSATLASVIASTEELAGCLAVKAAVEASSSSPLT